MWEKMIRITQMTIIVPKFRVCEIEKPAAFKKVVEM